MGMQRHHGFEGTTLLSARAKDEYHVKVSTAWTAISIRPLVKYAYFSS